MTFDYKKEYKEWYLPPKKPGIITVPKMQYVAVRGTGDPNESEGAYQKAMGILYGISYTIKMSWKGEHAIPGYFSYVVPPLEGLWKMPEGEKIDLTRKGKLCWISMIRLPEFVTEEVFEWAKNEAGRKKNTDVSKAEFFSYEEGLCVQCMHIGPYDEEAGTIRKMEQYARKTGYQLDLREDRMHHEIYLGDPRRTSPEKLKTVIRQPVKQIEAGKKQNPHFIM